MKKVVLALLLATGIATPALADPPNWSATQVRFDRDGRDHDDRGKWRGDRHERASEHRDRRRYDRHDNWNNGRHVGRNHDGRHVDRHDHRSDRGDWQRWRHYDYNRPDPRYGRYYADRYYRDSRYYGVRQLDRHDRVYRGYDGRYYCRRSDGTTGLVLGAIGGGLLGDALAPGDSRTIGALIGGGLGALLGREIDRGGARCR